MNNEQRKLRSQDGAPRARAAERSANRAENHIVILIHRRHRRGIESSDCLM
jgi:hypothetical protein